MTTLEQMEARAQRQLDGMTINRDAMANDVLALVKTVRAMRKRYQEATAKEQPSQHSKTPLTDALDDIFEGILGKNWRDKK